MANEQVIWILTGAPAGSTLTLGDEFGGGTVNSEFRITGGFNGNRLTMRGDANNGSIYGTWTFDVKLVNTNTGCESAALTGFTVTANEPPSDAFRPAGTMVNTPFTAVLDYDADHLICEGAEATYGAEANTGGINNISWSISGGGVILEGENARHVKVRWDNPGTHTLTFTVTNTATGCTSTNSLEVTVESPDPVSISCPDDTTVSSCMPGGTQIDSFLQLGIDIDGEAAGDRSGTSVSLSADGNRVAIGAPSSALQVIRVTLVCMNGMARAGFSWAMTSMAKRQVMNLAGVYRCRQTAVAWR